MWVALRDSTNARTDEARMMSHECYGSSFTSRDDARSALIQAVREELITYVNETESLSFVPAAVTRLAVILGKLLDDHTLNSVEYDGLRFSIREFGYEGI